jgi:circadian clock protein KaiC
MKHSNQVRELVLTAAGVTLADVYLSGGEVLMGTMRWEKELEDRRAKDLALRESDLKQKQTEGALAETRAKIEAARAELVMREMELDRILADRATFKVLDDDERVERSIRRGGDREDRKAHRSAGPVPPRISR